MKKETSVSIQNHFVWALACIGWVFMLAELNNSYYELANLSLGVSPGIQLVGLLVFQVLFYGVFVVAFPVIFISQTIDFMKACKGEVGQ